MISSARLHLYSQVYDWDNLLQAWRQARKGKRGQPPAATFEQNVGENLLALQAELRDKSYRPGRAIHLSYFRLGTAAS